MEWVLIIWLWQCGWECEHASEREIVYQTEQQCDESLKRWKGAGQQHGGVCLQRPSS